MNATGTIRTGRESDLPAVRRLLLCDRDYREVDVQLLTTLTPDRHLIVLDDPEGALIAAALFTMHEGQGQLLLLVVSAECDDPHAIEARMFGVVEAMCTAFGAPTVDVVGQRALH